MEAPSKVLLWEWMEAIMSELPQEFWPSWLLDILDPGCIANRHLTIGGGPRCLHCGTCLRCFGTRVLRYCNEGLLVPAAPGTLVEGRLVKLTISQIREATRSGSAVIETPDGLHLVLEFGDTAPCICIIWGASHAA